ncbi:MAG: type II secretion system protein [Candidatus Shapirobacteria bacterium]|nr:type II secretion system protein [Candidatus Shapirobacteria bacterium]MDD5481533.1 type II secretion system protein [Candidatus Shapirobacteria bacterium]
MIKKKTPAFTLIEVLVATTIIAVLTAIGVVSYTSASRNSRDAKRLADVEQIRAALEMYRSDVGNYPASISFGGTLSDGGNTYMSPIPVDPRPSAGGEYDYSGADDDYTLTIYSEKNSANRCFGSLGEKNCP